MTNISLLEEIKKFNRLDLNKTDNSKFLYLPVENEGNNVFFWMIRNKCNFSDLNKIISLIREEFQSIEKTLLVFNGYIFKYLIISRDFYIWDINDQSLGDFKIDLQNFPDEYFIREIQKVLRNFTKKVIKCSGCELFMPQEAIAGKFFAGVYCKNCWEKTWRAEAIKETYN